ncbi:MAG: glycosyltransferase [Cyclobacteriaceae bacterium]
MVIELILILLGSLLLLFLLLPFFLVCINFLFHKRRNFAENKKEDLDFAFIITAYKNLNITKFCVESLYQQTRTNYHIYLIADDCEEDDNAEFEQNELLSILRPEKKLGSKVRSLKYALDNFKRDHQYICVLDPDNLLAQDFIQEISGYIENGYAAVQGRRVAKNTDTLYAKLDTIGESYHNYVQRYLPFSLNSSATIAGSGMVIKNDLFISYFENPVIKKSFNKVILGEDKVLHNHIVANGFRIAYAKNAVVYDEKISSGHQAERQRTRWINTYFQNIKQAGTLFFVGIINFNWNSFLFGLISLTPPLFILFALSLLISVISIFFVPTLSLVLVAGMLVFVFNFTMVLKLSNLPNSIIMAIWAIPLFIFRQIKALFNLHKSRNDFLTTNNSKSISLDKILNSSKIND